MATASGVTLSILPSTTELHLLFTSSINLLLGLPLAGLPAPTSDLSLLISRWQSRETVQQLQRFLGRIVVVVFFFWLLSVNQTDSPITPSALNKSFKPS